MNTFFYQQTDSTNLEARRIIKTKKAQAPFWVVSSEQTQGKGYGTNYWESEAGKNFTGSLVFKPNNLLAGKQFYLSKLVTLGISDFLELFVEGVSIKWPNDLYVGGKKIAGVLIENDIMGSFVSISIIGIGLNINQTRFLSDAPNPVSLKELIGWDLDVQETSDLLRKAVENRLIKGFNSPIESLDEEYLRKLYRYKCFAPYKYDGAWLEARIVGIGEFGELLLEDKNGKISAFSFKEVEFILP